MDIPPAILWTFYSAIDSADWYSENYYARSPQSSPPGPTSGQYRVLRGGSWGYDARHARVAYRGTWTPDNRSYYRGFRCILRLAS